MFLIILVTILIANCLLFYYNYSIAKYFQLFDKPDNVRKLHKDIVPITGGIIIISNLLIFFILKFFFNFEDIIFTSLEKSLIFLTISLLFFLLGIIDDKIAVNANTKFLIITLIILVAMYFDKDLIIQNIRLDFISFDLGLFSIPWTLICFLLFINSLNMFDGYNLQSSSFSIFFLTLLLFASNFSLLIFVLILSLLFFSILNFKSKSFMGDSGTYMLAFVIGAITIKLYNLKMFENVDTIVLIMIIPGIDLMRLFFERTLIEKKSPFSPDRRHLHHLLLKNYGLGKTFFTINLIVILPYFFGVYFSIELIAIFIQIILYFFIYFFLNRLSKN